MGYANSELDLMLVDLTWLAIGTRFALIMPFSRRWSKFQYWLFLSRCNRSKNSWVFLSRSYRLIVAMLNGIIQHSTFSITRYTIQQLLNSSGHVRWSKNVEPQVQWRCLQVSYVYFMFIFPSCHKRLVMKRELQQT